MTEEHKTTAWKLPPSLYLAMGTLIFSISGYIYSDLYYRGFGIEVSKFFSLEDYLRNSIDRVSTLIAAISILLLVLALVLLWQRKHDNKKDKLQERINKSKFLTILVSAVNITCWSVTVVLLVLPIRSVQVYFALQLIFIFFYGRFMSFAWENKPFGFQRGEWIILQSMLLFVLLVIVNANRDAAEIKAGNTKLRSDIYALRNIDAKGLRHIGSTSQFMFFYDERNASSLVVPIANLDFVRIPK